MEAWKKSALGVATAGVLLLGVAAVPAQAASPISAGNGQIIGKGTAVSGTYTVDCDFAGQRIAASINVIQNRGGRINSNGTQQEFTCDSAGQVTREYLVFANERGYVPGTATVRVGTFFTDESTGFFTGVENIGAFPVQLRNTR